MGTESSDAPGVSSLGSGLKDERLCGTAGGYLSLISDKPGQVTKQKRGRMIGSF